MDYLGQLSLLLVMTVMIHIQGSSGLTQMRHMTNHCYKTVHVNDSLILDLTENLHADRVMVGHLSCAVTLQAPSDARVYLHVLQLAISDDAQMPDRLHIYEVSSSGKITKRLTPSSGLYGVLERPFLIYNTAGMIVPDFRTTGSRMRLDYQGKPTIVYRGFRVLVTVFYSPDANGNCRPGTVHCPYAGTCVPLSVRCDSLPNCGTDDNADEKTCQREYVVSNILEEYSTRTAIITAVTGILVFLGVAALVFVIVLKYTRKKYGRGGTDPSVHYSSRRGGSCRIKNETDHMRLYAPPSYQDVMAPDGRTSSMGSHRHRHCEPPPAYDAVAALVHQEGGTSSDEEVGPKPHLTARSMSAPAKQHTPSERQILHGSSAQDRDEENDDDVRMHGTWPSDTDEEEEVKARRRKKGGKVKGTSRQNAKSSALNSRTKEGVSFSKCPDYENIYLPVHQKSLRQGRNNTAASSPSSCPESNSDTSPAHHASAAIPITTRSMLNDRGSGSGSGGEVVSETESQLASSKRNSRTESNSPYSSNSSSHSASPAKSGCPSELTSDAEFPPSNSVQPPSKLCDKRSSPDAAHLKSLDSDERKAHSDFVDLNPSHRSGKEDLLVHN